MAALRSDRTRKPYSRPEPRSKGTSDGMWLHDKAPLVPGAVNRPTASANTKLIVSNLHYEITPKDLTAIFGQIGTLVREPLIRYDRSGRSSGVAVIFFETPAEATRAKKQFDGILAKGQPMSIAYDTTPPPAVRNTRRVASESSLLSRIQKPPLLDRLSRDDIPTQPRAAALARAPTSGRRGAGPIRTRARGGGGAGAGTGTGGRRAPKKPQTAEELDKELDAFMGDDDAAAPAAPGGTEADVDMV